MHCRNTPDLTRPIWIAFTAVFIACSLSTPTKAQGIRESPVTPSEIASQESKVREHPNSKKELEVLAHLFRYSRRDADAEKQWIRIIALLERNPVVDMDGLSDAYLWLGQAQAEQRKYVEGERSYERAIEIAEHWRHRPVAEKDARWRKIVALAWLTECYADHGDKQSALKTYQRLVATNLTPEEWKYNFADIVDKLKSIGVTVNAPHPTRRRSSSTWRKKTQSSSTMEKTSVTTKIN